MWGLLSRCLPPRRLNEVAMLTAYELLEFYRGLVFVCTPFIVRMITGALTPFPMFSSVQAMDLYWHNESDPDGYCWPGDNSKSPHSRACASLFLPSSSLISSSTFLFILPTSLYYHHFQKQTLPFILLSSYFFLLVCLFLSGLQLL